MTTLFIKFDLLDLVLVIMDLSDLKLVTFDLFDVLLELRIDRPVRLDELFDVLALDLGVKLVLRNAENYIGDLGEAL